ncbi:MAG: serine/threonine-protein kinase [Verrucomicrobiota bacterium]
MSNSPLLEICPACQCELDLSACDLLEDIVCPQCDYAFTARTQLGPYRLKSLLGEGGLSKVYLAEDETLGRTLALKVLSAEFAKNESWVTQLEKEARITASISHPNVVQVYSAGSADGKHYVAMELIDGGTLHDLIEEKGHLEAKELVPIAVDLIDGLNAAHEKGLIHRDIKPGNILMAADGSAKIVDFGFALLAATEEDQQEELWATPFYVPPEKLEGEPEDFRSDLFSLGATLFHAVTGEPPHQEGSDSISALREAKKKPARVREKRRAVPLILAKAIEKMMAWSPDGRYQSYREARRAIQQSGRGQLSAASTGGGQEATTATPSQAPARPFPLLPVLAGVALLGALATVLLVQGGKKEEGPGQAGPSGESRLAVDRERSGAVGAQFLESQELLLAGQFEEAEKAALELARDEEASAPIPARAALNAALAAYLSGDGDGAMKHLELLRSVNQSGAAMDARLYDLLDWTQRQLLEGGLPDPDLVASLPADSLRRFAFLALGLHCWEAEQFLRGEAFLAAFAEADFGGSDSWVGKFQALAEPYLKDAVTLEEWEEAELSASPEEALEEFAALKTAYNRLLTKGAAPRKLGETLSAFESALKEQQKAANEKEASRMARAVREELAGLRDPWEAAVAAYAENWGLGEALAVLQAGEAESREAQAALATLESFFQEAGGYLEGMEGSLKRYGYSGRLMKSETAIAAEGMEGVRIEEGELRFILSGRSLSFPVEKVPAAHWAAMSQDIIRRIPSSEELLQLRAAHVSFLLAHGVQGALLEAQLLALDDPEFRDRWATVAPVFK